MEGLCIFSWVSCGCIGHSGVVPDDLGPFLGSKHKQAQRRNSIRLSLAGLAPSAAWGKSLGSRAAAVLHRLPLGSGVRKGTIFAWFSFRIEGSTPCSARINNESMVMILLVT